MSRKSLLIVEDEVLVARDIKARLVRMGYDVIDMASKGAEAIEKALRLKPDLVLMDINLRDEIDGVEAAIRIREQYDVPVIFCTAYSNEDTLERAKISEPYGYVLKPFDNRELEINIEIALYKHRVERDLADTRRRLDATLTNVSDGVIAADMTGQIFLINPMAEKITGWCRRKARHVHLSNVMSLEPFEAGMSVFDTRNPGAEGQCNIRYMRQYLRKSGGYLVPIELSVSKIESQDSDLIVITFRDISQQLSYEEQIRHSAFFDDLTGLPNRALFFDRLEGSLNRRKRAQGEPFAVAFLDLDGFSAINEGLGHETGDEVIKVVAQRLEDTVRPDDTMSRFSGDIFAVLLDPVDSVTGAITAVHRIQHAVEQPIELKSTTIHLNASVGIVLHQEMHSTPEEMVRDADTALHRAKADSKGSYVVFDSEMYQSALRYIEYRRGIQEGITNGAFEVYYQPIVDVRTERLASMEALVRWRHPEQGYVSPTEFIPIAEETGLILPLGEWVLRSVCEQVNQWNRMGLDGFRVAVNLSARQFDNNVPGLVSSIMQQTGVSAHSLALEITEGIAMKNVEHNVGMLKELRRLGLNISIDDFGTGYSSLAYLKRFPLNTLKIDQSFIKDITTNLEDREITRAIIAMGQNLRFKVLAEGVETEDQIEILRES
ncbi:MAG TPA: EAL domain-containing protein, partial [Pseudomonadales bacterium]|nr:EAL domain-containing protein [Pseudomonadales bacterium]